MFIVVLTCLLLIAVTTVIHYEILQALNARLASLHVPHRSKLLVVMFAAFFAHALEIVLYGLAVFILAKYFDVGTLQGTAGISLLNFLYFSAETYTSLGFGDLTPVGPLRLLAGTEALNGLLLIGWSASYTYIAMERFWRADKPARRP